MPRSLVNIVGTVQGAGSGVQLLWSDEPSLIYEGLADFLPGANVYRRNRYLFSPLNEQGIEAIFRVPTGYTPGNNITLKFNHTNGGSGTYGFGVTSGIMVTEDSILSAGSSSAGSFTASTTLKSSTAVIAPSGMIGIAVQPGDLIWVFVSGNFNTTHDVTLFGSSSEVTFS